MTFSFCVFFQVSDPLSCRFIPAAVFFSVFPQKQVMMELFVKTFVVLMFTGQ